MDDDRLSRLADRRGITISNLREQLAMVEGERDQAEACTEKAEADLAEAIKQVAAMSDEMGKVEAERDELRKQRDALVKIVHAGSVRSPGACALLAEIAKEEAGG